MRDMTRIDRLQLFAAGDVVNFAGDRTPSDAGTINANTGLTVSTGDLAPEMKTFYDRALILMAEANLVHDQFGQKRPIPKNGGKTIEFRKFSKLPKALTPITEGVTPVGNKLRVTAITAQVDQYGDYIEQTDLLELTTFDNTIVEATRELAAQAGLTLDTVVRNELVGGTNVYYAPDTLTTPGTEVEVTSRADVTANCPLRVKDVFRMAAQLKAVNAPKINGSYVAIVHPYVAYDLMQEAGESWIGIQKYADPENILRGEIGQLGGVRFVESTEAKIFGPDKLIGDVSRALVYENASASTSLKIDAEFTTAEIAAANAAILAGGGSIPVYVNGTANTVTAVTKATGYTTLTLGTAVTVSKGALVCGSGAGADGSAVFCTLFLADNAYGVTELEGGGLEQIVKQKGYGNDPLNQRSSIGWKATKVAKRLLEEYMVRVESGSAFSATAESN